MPRRLSKVYFASSKEELLKLCKEKSLNDYETELILRIYWQKQSLNYIADTMEFDKYGKEQKHYSVRSINNFHKQAFLKLMR